MFGHRWGMHSIEFWLPFLSEGNNKKFSFRRVGSVLLFLYRLSRRAVLLAVQQLAGTPNASHVTVGSALNPG